MNKNCENCVMQAECNRCPSRKGCTSFSLTMWQRNPHLWLSILPTEPGWYWFREVFPEILQVEENNKILEIYKNEKWKALEEYHGVWQGPIRPEGE